MDNSVYQFLFSAFAFVLGAAVGSFLNVCIYQLASRSFGKRAAPLFLSSVQEADSVASKSAVDQLARAPRPLRKLREQNRLSLFCRGIAHRASFPRHLAKLFVADGDRVLDFCFVPHRRDIHRFRAFHHSRPRDDRRNNRRDSLPAWQYLELMDTDSRVAAGIRSVLAAVLGYLILLIVLEAGKSRLWEKRIRFDAPTPFTWKKTGRRCRFRGRHRTKCVERSFRARERSIVALMRRGEDRQSHLRKMRYWTFITTASRLKAMNLCSIIVTANFGRRA